MATRTTTSRSTSSPSAVTKPASTNTAKSTKAATEAPKAPAAPRSKAAAGETTAPAAKASTKKTTAPAKTAKTAKTATQITPEQRQHYIEEAAYYIAERRGFADGTQHDDWAEAEALIDRMLAGDPTQH